jgi:hypothetical protein
VLAIFGGAGGALLALWGTNLLVSLGSANLPRIETVALDARVLAFTLAISLLTGVAFGLAPALKASRRDLTESLREGERGATEGFQRGRLRNVLIASEFALALVLLIGAGLMIRSFAALESIDPGFDPRRVLTLTVSVAGTREADPSLRAGFYRRRWNGLARFRASPRRAPSIICRSRETSGAGRSPSRAGRLPRPERVRAPPTASCSTATSRRWGSRSRAAGTSLIATI